MFCGVVLMYLCTGVLVLIRFVYKPAVAEVNHTAEFSLHTGTTYFICMVIIKQDIKKQNVLHPTPPASHTDPDTHTHTHTQTHTRPTSGG
jgi:hypothetical protein